MSLRRAPCHCSRCSCTGAAPSALPQECVTVQHTDPLSAPPPPPPTRQKRAQNGKEQLRAQGDAPAEVTSQNAGARALPGPPARGDERESAVQLGSALRGSHSSLEGIRGIKTRKLTFWRFQICRYFFIYGHSFLKI